MQLVFVESNCNAPNNMVHYSYFNGSNLLRHDKPDSRGVTTVLKEKVKHTTVGYNLGRHSLLTIIASTFVTARP